jgi:5-(carboxyamino)imidazole ribonucleotide mutase
MPNGVPVATVALNAARNAGILAAQILATSDQGLLNRISDYKESLREKVLVAAKRVEGKSKSNPKTKASKVVSRKK